MSTAKLPKLMWAWRKHTGSSEAVYEEISVPVAPADGYLVQILAAGVCHSDYVLINTVTHPPTFNEIYTLGHEGCGIIVDVGDQVGSNPLRVGDKVVVFAVPGCGEETCPQCSRGFPQLCFASNRYGLGSDGSFTEYVAAHARAVVSLPRGVSPAVGAVATDAVLTAYHAIVRRGGVQKDHLVFQFGLGGLGFNGLQILLALGVRVIVSDVKEDVLKAAAEYGVPAEDIVPVGKSAQDFVKEKGLEDKIDIVLDFVGVKQTFSDAQVLVRRGGTIVGIGILSPETQIDMHICVRKRISVLFSYGGQREDLIELLNMISQGTIRPLVKMAKMGQFPKVLANLHAGKVEGRVALLPNGVEPDSDVKMLEV